MTEVKHAAFGDLVVVTEVKPDGRRIHYYEWPDPPPEPAKERPAKAPRPEKRRV